jgi:hypothetical protein
MATQNAQFNTSLLDRDIDDIEDLAGFEVPPNGVYLLKFNAELKVVNDKDAVEAAFEVMETLEQNDTSVDAPVAGTKFSTLFFVENPIAIGKLKEFLKPIAVHTGIGNTLQLVQQECKDLIISATVLRKAAKDDPEKFYATVKNVTIA